MYKPIKDLGGAVVLQAVRDYFDYPDYQQVILKDLNGDWMDLLSGGTAKIVAEKLKKNPEEIREIIKPKFKLGGIN